MENVLNNIENMAKEIRETFSEFMLKHSRIEPKRALMEEEVICFSPEGDRCFDYLDEAGRKVQAALKESYGKFYSMLEPLVQGQPEEVISKMEKLNVAIVRAIEHRMTWAKNTQEALDGAVAAIDNQIKLVKELKK